MSAGRSNPSCDRPGRAQARLPCQPGGARRLTRRRWLLEHKPGQALSMARPVNNNPILRTATTSRDKGWQAATRLAHGAGARWRSRETWPWLVGIRGPLEGAGDGLRCGGGYRSGRDPFRPVEPVPPLTAGVGCGSDVAGYHWVTGVLHEQAHRSSRRRRDASSPAARDHLSRQCIQAGDLVLRREGGASGMRGGQRRPHRPTGPRVRVS